MLQLIWPASQLFATASATILDGTNQNTSSGIAHDEI